MSGAARTALRESVEARYLGFTLTITDHTVEVRRGAARLETLPSVRSARLFIRGYRREERRLP
jgi:hypothetical protein